MPLVFSLRLCGTEHQTQHLHASASDSCPATCGALKSVGRERIFLLHEKKNCQSGDKDVILIPSPPDCEQGLVSWAELGWALQGMRGTPQFQKL